MFIIHRGKGTWVILVPLFLGLSFHLASALIWPTREWRPWMAGLMLLASGGLLWWWGRRLNRPLDRAVESEARRTRTDPVLEIGHSLYEIRMEYWGILYLILGVILCAGSAAPGG
jgi:hypothetical protein